MSKKVYVCMAPALACLGLLALALWARPANAAVPVAPLECGLAWRTVPSPNVGGVNNSLAAVASISPTDAWAVGTTGSVGLTMHWDGVSWNVVSNPCNGPITGVSAITSNDVWAVGNAPNNVLVTMHWNGGGWIIVPCPSPGYNYTNSLYGVDALSTNDVWTVGFYRHFSPEGLTMHWDGTTWNAVTSPGTPAVNSFQAVKAFAANDVWAVGAIVSTSPPTSIIMHYDGSAWTNVPVTNVGKLSGVDGAAPNDVWAVGASGILHYDGSTWGVSPAGFTNLRGLEAIAGNDVWAVGDQIAHWNGSAWLYDSTPSGTLNGVDGSSSSDLWAVGSYQNGGLTQTFIERYSDAGPCTTATPTSTPVSGTPTASPTPFADLNGSISWTSICPTSTLQLVTHLDIALGNGIGATTSRLQNANGDFLDVAVPPLNYHSYGNTHTYNCAIGSCVPASWLNALPFTYTVDYPNQIQETNEANNSSSLNSSPPPCATPTSTPQAFLVGHVVWQGRPGQPSALQQAPITLTLRSGVGEVDYPVQMTDAGGYFTVTVGGMSGLYNWRVKGPKYLARSGSVTLSGAPTTSMEIGLMLAGDATDDNRVNASDFNVLKVTFGKSAGDPGYDDRADFTGDSRVNASDFNLLKANFGVSGASRILP